LERREGDVLALACRGVSTALSARYKSGLEARREQHELILLHPHPTVPSYAATNPLTKSLRSYRLTLTLTRIMRRQKVDFAATYRFSLLIITPIS
jgi:hypothetical protein